MVLPRSGIAGLVMLALAFGGCNEQKVNNGYPTNNQPSQQQMGEKKDDSTTEDSRPLISCYSADVYYPQRCLDESRNVVPQEELNRPGFWKEHRRGYIQIVKPKVYNVPIPEQKIRQALGMVVNSDAYLVDTSASMDFPVEQSRARKWDYVARQPFPSTADLYVFEPSFEKGGLRIVNDRSNLETLCCNGGTPLWSSLNQLLNTKKYKEITVLTDGGDDGTGGFSVNDIIRNAGRTKINIIGVDIDSLSDFILLTQKTGGKYVDALNLQPNP